MGKIFLIIGIVYFVYYAGNIIYDLFIKKDTTVVTDENSEEFSIDEIAAKVESPLSNVEIDSVEDLKTPNSFNSNKLNVQNAHTNTEDPEFWRQKFEEEQNIDSFSNESSNINKPTSDNSNTLNKTPEETPVSNGSNSTNKDLNVKWQDLLNMAETKVQLVSNIDGYKVYKAI